MTQSHYKKWTNQFIDECSTFSPTLSTFHSTNTPFNDLNNYKITEQLYTSPTYSELLAMPQQYRNYARSLSRSRSLKKSPPLSKMHHYLQSLDFIKCRHKENCLNQHLLRKRRANYDQFRNNFPQQVTNHHTVQTVFVPSPPVHIHHQPIIQQPIIQQPIIQQPIIQHPIIQQPVIKIQETRLVRPASATKLSINYVSPIHLFTPTQTPQRFTTNSSQYFIHNGSSPKKYKKIQVAQQQTYPKKRQIFDKSQLKRSQTNVGEMLFNTKSSGSFRVYPQNIDQTMIHTFKQISGGTK